MLQGMHNVLNTELRGINDPLSYHYHLINDLFIIQLHVQIKLGEKGCLYLVSKRALAEFKSLLV